MLFRILLILLSFGAVQLLHAEESKEWYQSTKISGFAFGDAYWFAGHHNEDIKGSTGFWFRRIYLTLDSNLGENFSARLRFEAASPGDLKSKDKLTTFFKDVYLAYKFDRHQVMAGLISSTTYDVIEKLWGYRSVEKTPVDLYKMGASRDFGIGVSGSFDAAKKIRYSFVLANGSDTGGETNKGKKAMLSLSLYPNESLTLEGYADYEELPMEANRMTLQAVAGVSGKKGRAGAQFISQSRKSETGDETDLAVGSVFAVAKIGEKMNALVRFDHTFDAMPGVDTVSYLPMAKDAKSNLILVGLDWAVGKNVNIIPNVEVLSYDAEGESPDTDIVPRMTVYYRF